ncbi:hypothetical protein EKD04_002875 [Chloroflexales bacterium ZM16-3]|nr:hypothetical protein [Chloroflexales bacterium ZM16-3]
MPTKRRAREVLDVSPYLVREFSPLPSPTLVAQARAAIEDANVQGWIAVDPDTMDQELIHRLKRGIQVIKNAPEDGKFFAGESDGTVLRKMTGADTHVIYSVVFCPVGRVLRIARIEPRLAAARPLSTECSPARDAKARPLGISEGPRASLSAETPAPCLNQGSRGQRHEAVGHGDVDNKAYTSATTLWRGNRHVLGLGMPKTRR